MGFSPQREGMSLTSSSSCTKNAEFDKEHDWDKRKNRGWQYIYIYVDYSSMLSDLSLLSLLYYYFS